MLLYSQGHGWEDNAQSGLGRTLQRTCNNVEYRCLIFGIHARDSGITYISSIRGVSKLVINHISGRACYTARSLALLLGRSLSILQRPYGIDIQLIRPKENTSVDDAKNLGIRNRSQARSWSCYDGYQTPGARVASCLILCITYRRESQYLGTKRWRRAGWWRGCLGGAPH